MSTFLELAQATARESGTLSGVQPSSVVGQTGRLLKVVSYTAEAWRLIQLMHASWRFMRKELPSTCLTTAGTARYTAASWSITDLAAWITEEDTVSIYKQSTGVSDESHLRHIDWREWRRLYDFGAQSNDRPTRYAISPANEFCLGAAPDATYVVRGEYRRTPQILSANSDVPICPEQFHSIIVWRAVMLMDEHDEAPPQKIEYARQQYAALISAMERDQLPQITIGAAALA